MAVEARFDMPPECRDRFETIRADIGEIKADVKHLRRVLTDDPDDSLAAVVNRHRAYWKLFSILAAVAALACTVAGTIYAAIR